MAKEVVKKIKIQIPAGKATPAPPVGTVLGPAGINLGEFCSKFNDATREKMGDVVPCEISIYDDRSFDFVLKTAPAGFLLKKAAKIDKGSKKGANEIVATITKGTNIDASSNNVLITYITLKPLEFSQNTVIYTPLLILI